MADHATLLVAVDALLPQTQCMRCGYAGCRPYAAALVNDAVSPARCPPGGEATHQGLVALLERDDDSAPLIDEPAQVADIREMDCIGCTQCLDVCPVDAIIGAAGRMHTVFSAWCTGCGLCVPVCPTECITLPASQQAMPSPSDNVARNARHIARLDDRHTLRRAPALIEFEAEASRLRAAVLAAVARKQGAP